MLTRLFLRARWRSALVLAIVALAVLAGCTAPPPPPPPDPASRVEVTASPAVEQVSQPAACVLPTAVVPTPSADPGYVQLDPDTGLHVTGSAVIVDLATYRLKITGKVAKPLSLTYDELRCLPKQTCHECLLICPGFFEDTTTWSGAALAHVLNLAGVNKDAQAVQLVSADGYSTVVTLTEALAAGNLLAYEWEDEPVPVLHGFPVRAVFPRLMGGNWAKWLVEIRVQ
jgi:DMSO/TMAO reductase YedYZ molybdopterin-dependent catalytic subunit